MSISDPGNGGPIQGGQRAFEMGRSDMAGRIPVILVVGGQEPLRESALASRELRAPRIDLREALLPRGATIDPFFPAVPLGSGRAADIAFETTEPNLSETFAIRAFMEAADPSDLPEETDNASVFSDPVIEAFPTCGSDPALGSHSDVSTKLDCPTLDASGLHGARVAIAVVDSGINLAHLGSAIGRTPRLDVANSWTPSGVIALPGTHRVDHGTMCAYDALIAAPNATLLDYPVLLGQMPGSSSVSGTLSVALLAYAQLLVSWAVGFGAGSLAAKYTALVVNNSWGVYHPSWDFPPGHRGRYIDNPNHPFHLQVTALARAGADILFAAGNCGAHCPSSKCQGRTTETIMGANAHADVLTLAGCDIDDAHVGYSSQGPSIAGMPQEKPDLTAYTHFSGSEAFGAGSADTGTSTACPVAAGCVAALRTREPPSSTPPANLFAQLRSTARQVSGVGWNAEYGFGIINPVQAAQSMGLLNGP